MRLTSMLNESHEHQPFVASQVKVSFGGNQVLQQVMCFTLPQFHETSLVAGQFVGNSGSWGGVKNPLHSAAI